MLKTRLSDYSDTYILEKGTITITEAGADAAARNMDERNKQVTFKSYTLFTDCICKINNTQICSAKDLDIVMLMYLIEHNNNYGKTSGSVPQRWFK